jgi:hypothetical protein
MWYMDILQISKLRQVTRRRSEYNSGIRRHKADANDSMCMERLEEEMWNTICNNLTLDDHLPLYSEKVTGNLFHDGNGCVFVAIKIVLSHC